MECRLLDELLVSLRSKDLDMTGHDLVSRSQIDKVPATHVASPKLPYPLPGSGRRAETLACSYTEAPNQVENNP